MLVFKEDVSAWPKDFQVPRAPLTFGAVKSSGAGVGAVAAGAFWAEVACSTGEAGSLSGEVVVGPCMAGQGGAAPFWAEVAHRAGASFVLHAWDTDRREGWKFSLEMIISEKIKCQWLCPLQAEPLPQCSVQEFPLVTISCMAQTPPKKFPQGSGGLTGVLGGKVTFLKLPAWFTQRCSPGGDGEEAPGWQKYPGEQGPEGAVRPGEPQKWPGGHCVQLESCPLWSLRGTEAEFQLAGSALSL